MRGYVLALFLAASGFLAMPGVAGDALTDIEDAIMDVVYDNCRAVLLFEHLVGLKDTKPLHIDELTTSGLRSYSMYPDYAKDIMASSQFDPKRKTVIYIHGFANKPTDIYGQSFGSAYILHGGYNIFALDSSMIIGMLYYRSSAMVKYIGEALGIFLHNLIKSGVHVQDIHLIGDGLGAQIAGFAGKTLIKISEGSIKLPRITGLDPSGPCFTHRRPEDRLDREDAEFVDIINRNKGSMGFLGPIIGHAEFFPNGGGMIQPGCMGSICSHFRSTLYFDESVNHNNNFIGSLCKSEEDFYNGLCNDSEKAVMGYATPKSTRGTFYLWTGRSPTYGKSAAGAILHNTDVIE